MKGLILACTLCGLIWLPAAGQRGGTVRGGGSARPAVPVATFGIPPAGSIPPLGTTTAVRGSRQPGRGFGGGYGYWFPGLYDGYPGDNYGYQATPSLVAVPQEVRFPEPPRIAQGEVRDYAKTSPPETAAGPPPEFSVVGKDHVAHPAVAVWTQDGSLHYLDADGGAGMMPLSAVDREATRQANAAKGLRLQLQAE
jgi:hypothetical protein